MASTAESLPCDARLAAFASAAALPEAVAAESSRPEAIAPALSFPATASLEVHPCGTLACAEHLNGLWGCSGVFGFNDCQHSDAVHVGLHLSRENRADACAFGDHVGAYQAARLAGAGGTPCPGAVSLVAGELYLNSARHDFRLIKKLSFAGARFAGGCVPWVQMPRSPVMLTSNTGEIAQAI